MSRAGGAPSPTNPILIIGAGLVGLTLAQALQRDQIPFLIFERDAALDSRSAGWGITIHWALPALKSCLPPELFALLPSIQVDPAAGGENDNGKFQFIDLRTGKVRFKTPPAERWRVNRRGFREVLSRGVDVQWGCEIAAFEVSDEGVEVRFGNGREVRGCLLVGADGGNSKVRQLICPETWNLQDVGVRMLGVTERMSGEEIEPLRAIDPLLFQGADSETGVFMWFSVLSSPEVNGSAERSKEEEFWEAQICLSWKVDGKWGVDVPERNEEKLRLMKRMASTFDPRLRQVFEWLKESTQVQLIVIKDWDLVDWPGLGGRVTLCGDAAHAMTMYRGEAGNHGLTDAMKLHEALLSMSLDGVSQKVAIEKFEADLRERTQDAVLLNRQACLDAHDPNLTEDSPVVSKRTILRIPATIGATTS